MYSNLALLGLLAGTEALNAPLTMQRMPLAATRLAPLRMEAEAPAEAPAEEAAAEEAPPAPPAVEYSDALPFLTRRASLGPKGALVGDVGFDPLGFTEIFPLVRARAQLMAPLALTAAQRPPPRAGCVTAPTRVRRWEPLRWRRRWLQALV
jgi:hypothetical protein